MVRRRHVSNLFLQSIPANLSPSAWIRRVDVALMAGLGAAGFVYTLLSLAAWRSWLGHPVPEGAWFDQMLAYPKVLISQVSFARLFPFAAVDNPAAYHLTALHFRLFPCFALGLAAGGWVFKQGLTPWRRMRHIEGPRLLEGQEAEQAAQRIAQQELAGKETFMSLHPLLPLPKQRWTRGVLLYGSPGSGKTQALIGIIEQLIEAGHRAFIYDVKGDFTSYWLGGAVGLLCPWDKRSLIWDIGRDVRTPSDAKTFAASLIPEADGEGKFWSVATRQLVEGTLVSLQNELATKWGWGSLSERLSVDSVAMAHRMARHMPMAEALVRDPKSSTTNSILATLAGYTKLIHDLALAWGDGRAPNGLKREHISLTAWARDGYAGKIRQIIFQAGPDQAMTTALGTAMLNLLAPALLSAGMPDDEIGRTIAFVLDEMPSLGKIPFQSYIERGRSKGVVFCGACQDLEQIKAVWGEETMRSLGSMIGTHVVFRIQQSASRDAVAEQFGKARWAITAVNTTGGGGQAAGTNTSVHEESRAVVQSYELSELGPVRGKRFPLGWGVSAMVSLGGDVLLLEFPGVSPEKKRTPHRPARWTREPANPGQTPELTTVQRRAAEQRDTQAWVNAKSSAGEPPRKVESLHPSQKDEESSSRPTEHQQVLGRPGIRERLRAEAETSPLANILAGAIGGHAVDAALQAAEIVEHVDEMIEPKQEISEPVQTVAVQRSMS